jgi:hypothetical protein
MKSRSNSVLREVERLMQDLLAALPENSASMKTTEKEKSSVIELTPRNGKAAPISIVVPFDEKREVTLIAGKGSFFEIPPLGHRYTDFPFIEEVRSICLAVIAGTLSESVLFDGNEVLQGTGSIKLPQSPTPMTVRWRQLSFRPFRKKERSFLKYEPYSVTPNSRGGAQLEP